MHEKKFRLSISAFSQRKGEKRTDQITRRVSRSNRDSFQIARTIAPSNLSSAPTSDSSIEPAREPATDPVPELGALSGPGIASGFVIKSTESPRHPAAWRGLRGGGDLARSICRTASTFPLNTASYRLRAAGGTGVGRESWADFGLGVTVALVVALAPTLRVLTLVRDVAMLRIEERSEAEADVDAADVDASELRDDGGRGRGGGGGGGPSRFGTSKGECRGEGGTEGDFDGR